MNEVRYTEINAEEDGQRLDNYLIRILKGVPKSRIYRMIRGGEIRVNKKRSAVSQRLIQGDIVRIPPVRSSEEKPMNVSLQLSQTLKNAIIYEDAQLLVLNKPSGMAVHGGSGVSLGVIEALRKSRQDLPYLELVHRLDKETSGCLLLAKKRSVLRSIQSLLETRQVRKLYWALLNAPWSGKKQVQVEIGLQKNRLQSGERMVHPNAEGKSAQTTFKLLENYQQACWVEARPKTGRTHQIRVHSAYLGHPIVGDRKYGSRGLTLGGEKRKQKLYLHAREIQFTLNDKNYHFKAELDEQFSQILLQLRG